MRHQTLRRLCLATVALLGGCSGITQYRSSGDKNFEIRTTTENARASIDVYRVDSSCRPQYEGTITLDSPRVDVGVPANRLSLLVFNFSTSAWLGSSRSTMARETLFRPKPGHRYRFDLSYRNDIYNIVAHENGVVRELDLKGLETCR